MSAPEGSEASFCTRAELEPEVVSGQRRALQKLHSNGHPFHGMPRKDERALSWIGCAKMQAEPELSVFDGAFLPEGAIFQRGP